MIQLCFTWFRGERLKKAVKEFFRKYRDILLINKSIAVSGIISFVIGMIFTESHSGFAGPESNIENSIYTLVVGYASYLPIFIYLFYRDNKDRYVDPNSSTINSHVLIHDIRKLFAAFSVSEAVFIVTKTYIHFHLLESGYLEPYQAYFVAELIAWIVYFVSMNSILKAVKMYRVGQNSRRLSDPS
jgi:hypothetical protein